MSAPSSCVEIYHFCEKRRLVITLPDSVPTTISKSFSALIPFAFSVIILGGVYVAVKSLTGMHLGAAILSALRPAV